MTLQIEIGFRSSDTRFAYWNWFWSGLAPDDDDEDAYYHIPMGKWISIEAKMFIIPGVGARDDRDNVNLCHLKLNRRTSINHRERWFQSIWTAASLARMASSILTASVITITMTEGDIVERFDLFALLIGPIMNGGPPYFTHTCHMSWLVGNRLATRPNGTFIIHCAILAIRHQSWVCN